MRYDTAKLPSRPCDLPEGATLFDNGIVFAGALGTLVRGGWSGPPTLYPESRRNEFRVPEATIPRSIGHRPEWIVACKVQKTKDAKAGFTYSGRFPEALPVGNLALRLQKRIEWDAANKRASNAAEADELTPKRYRAGFGVGS